MTRPEPPKTPLEWLLHLWTGANVLVSMWVTIPLLSRPEVHASSQVQFMVGVLLLAMAGAVLLVWKLFRPSVSVLVFGTVFWGLQILSLQRPGALYKFRLGLSMDFRLTSDPDFIVAVNVLGVMLTIMFAMALKERLDAQRAAPAAADKDLNGAA